MASLRLTGPRVAAKGRHTAHLTAPGFRSKEPDGTLALPLAGLGLSRTDRSVVERILELDDLTRGEVYCV